MVDEDKDFFGSDDVMLLFTTALAGLGHIRVTQALRSGLQNKVRSELLGIDDNKIKFLHRLTSTNVVFRKIGDFIQNTPLVEEIFTFLYREFLRKSKSSLVSGISDLVRRRRPKPKVLVIVSTHFGLAHQIASIKSDLAKEINIKVVLCVIVTDDSPQKIWGVMGADYIFVPSVYTQIELQKYLERFNGQKPSIIISPYPISQNFSNTVLVEEFNDRRSQVGRRGTIKTQIVIPISGAAVQLSYFQDLISYLDKKSIFKILVVSRVYKYTKEFIRWCQNIRSVEVVADAQDRDVVTDYEKEFEKRVIALEVTKPSEQTFKTLLKPSQMGGVILLFSEPVGRQEKDNLNFLRRYGLIPSDEDQEIIYQLYKKKVRMNIDSGFHSRACKWRGLLLPKNGFIAGRVIYRLRKTGILSNMVDFQDFPQSDELSGDGVKIFWNKIEDLIKKQYSASD